jgi:N-methylhydantoinase A
VSVERGRDPREFALLAFGGNGPLFAASIATELGIGRIIVPPMPGVFSAFGLLVADAEHHGTRSLRMRIDQADQARIAEVLGELIRAGRDRLARDGFSPERQQFRAAAQARYLGQSSEIEVPLPGEALPPDFAELFGHAHERIYGFRAPPDEPVELVGLSVIARGVPERLRLPDSIPPAGGALRGHRPAWFPDTGWQDVPLVDRGALAGGWRGGPLIVQEYDATCLVPAGFKAELDEFGNVRLTRM